MRLRWPNQITPYRSALPGLAGPGMNITEPELPTKFYFITNTADNNTGAADPSKGPNCFSGSTRYCWYANAGAGFHKVIVPLIGGYGYVGRKLNHANSADAPNMDYLGHAAPGPGLILRAGVLNVQAGSNIRIWHCAMWCGDEAMVAGVELKSGSRDCFEYGGTDFPNKNLAFINCEGRFGMDEISQLGFSGGSDGLSWLRCAIYDPLHAPPGWGDPSDPNHNEGLDHGYGQLIGGGTAGLLLSVYQQRVLTAQSLYAHTTDRNPTICALTHAHVNNLHYNHGRPGGGRGEGCHMADNGGILASGGQTSHTNVVGNLTVMGPEQYVSQAQACTLSAAGGTFPAGCTAHSNFNSQLGWDATQTPTQDSFIRTFPYAGYVQPHLRLNAWYDGFGDQYQGVLKPFQNPMKPQVQEALEFSRLMRESCGMMPRRRYLYKGALHRVFDQIDAQIRGVSSGFQFINLPIDLASAEAPTGWEVMPTPTMIDPGNPTSDWHAPMPLDATRDDVLTTGMFSNGFSKKGYKKWRAWAIEQYLYVMGP